MADLGKVTPTKPVWSRVGETTPEEGTPQQRPHPKKEDDTKRDSDETPEKKEKPSAPDDEHQIDLFV